MTLAQVPSRRMFTKAAILGLLIGAAIWWLFFWHSALSRALRDFQDAYGNTRVVEARITALRYASRDQSETVDLEKRTRAQVSLTEAAAKDPGPAAENALGQFCLVNKRFDEAVEHLERSVGLEPRSARYRSDFAAALLEKGKYDSAEAAPNTGNSLSGRGIEEIARGLEQVEEALRLSPSFPEALFNRALCCQSLMLWNEAKQSWLEYLKKDSKTEWAEEAKRNLGKLEHRETRAARNGADLFQRFLDAYQGADQEAARRALSLAQDANANSIVDTLIHNFLEQPAGAGAIDADQALQMLDYATRIERAEGGDAFWGDVARIYRGTSWAQRQRVASARSAMADSHKLSQQSQLTDAIRGFTESYESFQAVGDKPEALLARYYIGRCYALQPDTEKAIRVLEEVRKICEKNSYQWLRANCLYYLAMVQTHLSEYSAAVDYSTQSQQLFEHVGDTANTARSTIQLAVEYQELSDEHTSLAYAQRVLNIAAATELDDSQQWQIYGLLAFNLASLGLNAAAADCWKEALGVATKMGRPLITSRTYEYLGFEYAKSKEYDKAIDAVSMALEMGSRMGSEPGGLNIVANSCVMLGNIHRQAANYKKAIEFYDRGSEIYRLLELGLYDYPVHKGKLLSYLALGDDEAAEKELSAALVLVEGFRSKIKEETKRYAFFDAEQDIYDIAIDFEYSKKHDVESAFDFSEASRARSFLDLLEVGGRVYVGENGHDLRFSSISHPPGFAEIQRNLPDKTEIVQYSVLNDKVIIWVISTEGVSGRERPISADDLTDRVMKYLKLVSGLNPESDAETAERARDLYDILLSPIEPLLDRNRQICIVPDKILNYLPFGALVSPRTGAYLAEDYVLEFSPSATLFEACSKVATDKSDGRTENLLLVANPAFDRAAFPSLSELPGADREIDRIQRFYKRAVELSGKKADKTAAIRELKYSDIAHFATHSVIEEFSPLRSKLVMAAPSSPGVADNRNAGSIEAVDIYSLKLARTRLVVLSSCESGVERYYRGEGAIGLARPFIAAGVPLVIASLWKVDSEATADLMIAFHKHRKEAGLSSVEALRRAQLEMLRGRNGIYSRPFYWAAFAAYGGSARF
jgi:CHAT domain-containing protein